MQHDELDVLATHVHDDVWIFVEFQCGLGVRDGLDQSHISLEHIFQNVLGVSCGSYSQHFHARILGFHLLAQVLEHVYRVLNGITVRKLIRLAQNLAILIEQDSFRGS